MRKRSRLSDEIAKKNGFSGYSCISFLELENAPDERVIFDYINARIKAADTFWLSFYLSLFKQNFSGINQ